MTRLEFLIFIFMILHVINGCILCLIGGINELIKKEKRKRLDK